MNLRVDKPVKKEAAQAAAGESVQAGKTQPLTFVLAGGCGLLLLALLTQGTLMKRKMHLMEEEKL